VCASRLASFRRDQTAIYQCVFMQLRVSTVVMSNHFKYLLSKAYLLKEIVNGTQIKQAHAPSMHVID
jgi:hypothetical protein